MIEKSGSVQKITDTDPGGLKSYWCTTVLGRLIKSKKIITKTFTYLNRYDTYLIFVITTKRHNEMNKETYVLMASWKPLKKGAGSNSGSLLQWYGSPDPNPYQYVTDPEHCSEKTPTHEVHIYCTIPEVPQCMSPHRNWDTPPPPHPLSRKRMCPFRLYQRGGTH